jgi:hypothetical protein
LSNIQKLTPETDGNLYHTVHSGETLSWIAGWYGVSLADLMAWNGLNNASVIRPDQKLILRVTPPATATAPQTETPSPPPLTPSPTPSIAASPTSTPLVTAAESPPRSGVGLGLVVIVFVIVGLLWWRFSHKV